MNKKLGYYTCNNKEFESKIQAMMYSQMVDQPIAWHFNDEVFGNYKWAQEPELTLDQLYDRRAREIREQYDYVILSFSGGSDSNNILEAFLRQGLLIDEVISNWSLDASDQYTVTDRIERASWNHNAEFKLHATHRLDYIKQQSPRTKITVLDTSKALVDSFLGADDASWVSKKKEVLNAGGTNNYNYMHFAEVRKRFDKHQSIALIIGTDKPRVQVVDGKVYLYFLDKVVNMISVQDHITEYPNATPVFFYWDPEGCDIMCKQAHVIRKWIDANPQHRHVWETTDFKVLRYVQEELLKTIIYSTWNPTWFQVKKSLDDWDSELDYWFSKGWKGTREHSIWLEGLEYLKPRISTYLKTNNDGTVFGTHKFESKRYYIGDLNA